MSENKPANAVKDLPMRACILCCIGVLLAAVALAQQRAPEPCCTITAIDAQTGVVAAQVKATGQEFQFQVKNPVLLRGLRVGQDVYANLRARQVSLDGKTACCAITALGPASGKSERRKSPSLEARPGPTQASESAAGAKSRPAGDSKEESPEPKPPSGSTPPPDTPPPGGVFDRTGMEAETKPKKELPRLAYFSCYPARVIGGTEFTCTAGLYRASAFPAEVSIASSNNAIAQPDAPSKITIPAGGRAASLQIRARALPQSAPVTISASDGRTQRSATVVVLPAAIATFACSRCDVGWGESVQLLAILTAPAPASGYAIPVTPHKDNPKALQRNLTITVEPGSTRGQADFYAPDVGAPISGSFEVTDPVSGSVKGVRVRVSPPGVKRFVCWGWGNESCDKVHSGGAVYLTVELTAPAPPSGYSIPVTPHKDNPKPLQLNPTLIFKPGQTSGDFGFHAPSVAASISGSFEVTDLVSGSVRRVRVTVHPPRVTAVRLSTSVLSQVPLGGKQVTVSVFSGPAPAGGLDFPVQYGGTTDVQGPATVRVTGKTGSFVMNVSACGVSPPQPKDKVDKVYVEEMPRNSPPQPCTVWVEVDGKRATVTVNP